MCRIGSRPETGRFEVRCQARTYQSLLLCLTLLVNSPNNSLRRFICSQLLYIKCAVLKENQLICNHRHLLKFPHLLSVTPSPKVFCLPEFLITQQKPSEFGPGASWPGFFFLPDDDDHLILCGTCLAAIPAPYPFTSPSPFARSPSALIVSHSAKVFIPSQPAKGCWNLIEPHQRGSINPRPHVGVCGQGCSSHPTLGPINTSPPRQKNNFDGAVIGAKWRRTKAPSVLPPAGLVRDWPLSRLHQSPMWEESNQVEGAHHHLTGVLAQPSTPRLWKFEIMRLWQGPASEAQTDGADLRRLINPTGGRGCSFQIRGA